MPQSPLSPADRTRLQEFIEHIDACIPYMLGYPMAIDFDYQELYPLFAHHLNNVGDPYIPPSYVAHCKEMECEVIDFFADMFHAPKRNRWGYVTNGGTEGNLFALYLARTLHPGGVVYYSAAAHYSVDKAADMLAMPSVRLATDELGEMDYAALRAAAAANRGKPAIVVANIGSTMTEAKDNVAFIRQALKDAGVHEVYIHSDAAFAGIYVALREPDFPFDFAAGADSVSISGHKFIGSPLPCGIVLTKRTHREHMGRAVEYIGSADSTISGSRGGHNVMMLWYATKRWGVAGFKERARACHELADYTERTLQAIGWQVRRRQNALTILIATPPKDVREKWQLAREGDWCHLICAPGVSRKQIDAFAADLAQAMAAQPARHKVAA